MASGGSGGDGDPGVHGDLPGALGQPPRHPGKHRIAMAHHSSFRRMSVLDLPAVLDLWFGSDGLRMRTIDSVPDLERFLERNPGLSFVAEEGDRLVGAGICGHDGRRGYLHHLAVAPTHRGRGIGRGLAGECLQALTDIGVTKCHLFVRTDNPEAFEFWQHVGWSHRDDTLMLSRTLTADPNA